MQPKTGRKKASDMFRNYGNTIVEPMPFQKTPEYALSAKINKALNTFPIFGGTNPESASGGTETKKEEKEPDSKNGSDQGGSSSSNSRASSGGDNQNEDPQKVIADLLSQIEETNKTVESLKEYKNNAEQEKTKAERAKLSREEALQKDIEDRDLMIQKLDTVIRHVALVNALQSDKNIEFHSAQHALNELRDDEYEIDVDLDNGRATVTGIEKAIQRIKKDTPWLIKTDKAAGSVNGGTPGGTPGTPRPPASGRPATGGGGDQSKSQRRAALANRYPVITHGRKM